MSSEYKSNLKDIVLNTCDHKVEFGHDFVKRVRHKGAQSLQRVFLRFNIVKLSEQKAVSV